MDPDQERARLLEEYRQAVDKYCRSIKHLGRLSGKVSATKFLDAFERSRTGARKAQRLRIALLSSGQPRRNGLFLVKKPA